MFSLSNDCFLKASAPSIFLELLGCHHCVGKHYSGYLGFIDDEYLSLSHAVHNFTVLQLFLLFGFSVSIHVLSSVFAVLLFSGFICTNKCVIMTFICVYMSNMTIR